MDIPTEDTRALTREILDEFAAERDLKQLARRYVEKGRALLFAQHRSGMGGREIVSAYSTMMDRLIQHLFDRVSAECLSRTPNQNPQLAVVAQGGYGRGELNPQSDVDLLFLYSWKITPYAEAVAQRLLYTLWDAGLQVGHAVRSATESVQLADLDMKVKTALLDARYLCGELNLYRNFEKQVEKRLIKRRVKRFSREKLEENRNRHEGYGGSVYLLEPEVKEGEGGLRDLHTVRWIARVALNARDLDALAVNNIVGASDVIKLKESQDFLLRVRNELHFSSGKHQDQLTFEEQEKVSAALGFRGEGTLRAVEVFMRSYYLHAAQISRLTSLIIHRLTEHKQPLFGISHALGTTLRHGVRLSRQHLSVTDPTIFTADAGNLIQIFADMQQHRCQLSHETREMIVEHLPSIDDRWRRSAGANVPFFQILKWKEGVYDTLSEMHRSGVLGAFIPEFGRLLCMALHDAYHIYTVDQHSLRLVREIERLKAGEYKASLPLLTQLARDAEKIELLYLGLLFHDIGKGFGGGHSEIGARMVRQIARRMRLNVDDGAMVEFLVRHHLLMTHTAFRRDLEDEKTIFDFATLMGNVANLKMLYLLTFADVKAVGPDVWNPWKASLLGELYVKALGLLEEAEKDGLQRQDMRAVLRRVHGRLRRELAKDHDAARVNAFLESMPERYFLSTPEDVVPTHFELMEQFTGPGAVSSVQHFPERDCSSVVVCTRDRPGLFAAITGVLTSLDFDILNARIFTSSDGRILDVFRIAHRGRSDLVTAEHKWSKFRSTLDDVLEGRTDVARLVENSARSLFLRKRKPKVSTVIQIDNEASDGFTIIEVFTEDRLGVLFTITYGLHQLGLSIHVAKISTNVDQVADVFYITGEDGRKVSDDKRLTVIRDSLYRSLAPDHERVSEPLH